MSATPTPHHHHSRPLDSIGVALALLLCLSWGFNQVAVKLTLHDIPPQLQGAIRSVIAALLVAGYCRLRGIPLLARDGTLWPGVIAGTLFGCEFACIYQGLSYTTATRGALFMYLAPFFVVILARVFLPADKFKLWQWIGLCLSFAGMIVAFGLPTPALDPRQMLGDTLIVIAAMGWAITTVVIKASRLNTISPEKVMMYQLVMSAPIMGLAAYAAGETITRWPDAQAIGWMAYQTVWVVAVTFVIWFALIKKYSANRLSAFTVLTPLFGVAAGHFMLGDPLTPAFLAAVAMVAAGLILVNRAR
ncbi:MAG: DMT family transporter [Pseudolabrys sp.]|nr:DMT family transporter [Pseudolabrys sp.]